MRLKCVALFVTIGWTIVISVSAVAHHSFAAEYDTSKPITVTGYVAKLDWVNPHAFLYLDTRDEGGTVKSFKIEMGPSYALVRGGWSRNALKVGERISETNAVGDMGLGQAMAAMSHNCRLCKAAAAIGPGHGGFKGRFPVRATALSWRLHGDTMPFFGHRSLLQNSFKNREAK